MNLRVVGNRELPEKQEVVAQRDQDAKPVSAELRDDSEQHREQRERRRPERTRRYVRGRAATQVSPARADLAPQIAKRAYALYEDHGHRDGHAVEDWLQTERKIRTDEPASECMHLAAYSRSVSNAARCAEA